MTTHLDEEVRGLVDALCTDLVGLIRADMTQKLAVLLKGPSMPVLPPAPRRAPRKLNLTVRKALPSDLPLDLTGAEKRVLDALRKHGIHSSWEVARRLDRGESTVRSQLAKLVAKGAVRRQEEGTRVFYVVG